MTHASSREYFSPRERPDLRLELMKHESLLAQLAEPGMPLTAERLSEIAPAKLAAVEAANADGIEWPDENTALIRDYLPMQKPEEPQDSRDADRAFAQEVFNFYMISSMSEQEKIQWIEGQVNEATAQGIDLSETDIAELINERGYNNFTATIGSPAYKPDAEKPFLSVFSENPAAALYGSKPCLVRAQLLMPEFMDALRREVEALGGQAEWNDAIMNAMISPQGNVRGVRLLRASRLAYDLLVNLMRSDDATRQAEWIGMNNTNRREIVSPRTELWT